MEETGGVSDRAETRKQGAESTKMAKWWSLSKDCPCSKDLVLIFLQS